MPFEYWEDEHAALIRKSKAPEFMDPDYYVEAHFHPPGSKAPYFLNQRCRKLYDKGGPFEGRYRSGEELVDRFPSGDAYIFCPGPSMIDVNPARWSGCLTMAVNSAGFAFTPVYWVMAESAYARWLLKQTEVKIPLGGRLISTARVAVCVRDYEGRGQIFSKIYVVRWEEEKIVPPRVPAVSVFNALVTAWEMGCKRAYLIGLDLSKEGGPYLEGVPYTKEGAANPFDDQVKALSQFALPGMDVFNGSPVSRDVLPFDYVPYEEMPTSA
jgi:hypothetical protein